MLLGKLAAAIFSLAILCIVLGFPGDSDGNASACNAGDLGLFDPWVGNIPWIRKWQPTPVHLPAKSPGQRSLVGYSPWGHKELYMTEQIPFLSFPLFVLFFLKFYFIFKLYITVLVLPNIKMNPPQVYMCSPS